MRKKCILLFFSFFLVFCFLLAQTNWLSTDIRVDTGDPPGNSTSWFQQICSSGDNVYVVWEDRRNAGGFPRGDIYFNFSTDRGATWQMPAIRINTDTPGVNRSLDPKICCSGNNVYVTYSNNRNGSADIYFNYSTDGGVNWQPSDIRLDTGDPPGNSGSIYPEICCSGNNVYVVWEEYRNGNADIYFNFSTNGGATWQISDIRIDHDAGTNDAQFPEICCSGNYVYVTWNDYRDNWPNSDVYFNYSTNGGINWQLSDIYLDDGRDSKICCSDTNLYATWANFPYIYFNYSTDGGVNWQPSHIQLSTASSACFRPEICLSGNNIYVTWEDWAFGISDIYFNYSTDGGTNWQASEIRLDTGDTPHANDSLNPSISCYGENVYVTWGDCRGGIGTVYFNYSTDGGANWQSPDIRIDTGTDSGGDPKICCSANNIFVAWSDGRNGYSDIYFNTINEPPVANAGSDKRVNLGDNTQLDGTSSFDPDGDKISYNWNFLSIPFGSLATLCGANTSTPWFKVDKKGEYEVKLTVSDPFGESSSDSVTITVVKIFAPLNFIGKKVLNRSLSQAEYINVLSWSLNPVNENIVSYRIYLVQNSNWNLVVEIDSSTFLYLHRGVKKDVAYTYTLVAVNNDNLEGSASTIVIQ